MLWTPPSPVGVSPSPFRDKSVSKKKAFKLPKNMPATQKPKTPAPDDQLESRILLCPPTPDRLIKTNSSGEEDEWYITQTPSQNLQICSLPAQVKAKNFIEKIDEESSLINCDEGAAGYTEPQQLE